MKRLPLVAMIFITALSCGTVRLVDLSTAVSMPTLRSISTPADAQEALFIAAHIYHAATERITLAHNQNRVSDADYSRLVESDDSLANNVRELAMLTYSGVEIWGNDGRDRTTFDMLYLQLRAQLSLLVRAGR